MKKLISLLVFFGLLMMPGFSSAATTYTDLASSHPNFEAIQDLSERAILAGYPDKTFRPDQKVKRVEALKIIALAAGVNVNVVPAVTASYKDTDANAWYFKYVNVLTFEKVVNGNPDGTFAPERDVNLAEALKMLTLAAKVDLSTVNTAVNPYADVDKSAWYAKYFQYLNKDTNVLLVDANNRVNPGKALTRAELAEIIHRFLYVKENNVASYPKQEVLSGTVNIAIEDFAFSPKEIKVKAGTKIIWTNKDSSAHDVKAKNDSFKSPRLEQNQKYERVFSTAGVFEYYCGLHPLMQGKVTVVN